MQLNNFEDVVDAVRSSLLLKLPYAQEIGLFVFALLGAVKVKKIHEHDMNWAQSLVLTFLMCFGGGIVAPFLLGKPPIILVNDLIVISVLISWLLVNRLHNAIPKLVNFPIIRQVLVVIAETFKVNGICYMVSLATKEIPAGKFYPIPFWGPIVLGTLIGCGGMFLPFDKGLSCVAKGSPWPLQSSFYAAFAFHLLAHDPNFRNRIKDLTGAYTEDSAKASVVFAIVFVAILQTIFGEHFNPFRPFHNVMYVISGIKSGRVSSSEPAPQKKKNE